MVKNIFCCGQSVNCSRNKNHFSGKSCNQTISSISMDVSFFIFVLIFKKKYGAEYTDNRVNPQLLFTIYFIVLHCQSFLLKPMKFSNSFVMVWGTPDDGQPRLFITLVTCPSPPAPHQQLRNPHRSMHIHWNRCPGRENLLPHTVSLLLGLPHNKQRGHNCLAVWAFSNYGFNECPLVVNNAWS